MCKLYGSFRVRRWVLGHEERVEVQHIQSGTKLVASSLAEAIIWLRAYCRDTTPIRSDCAKGGPESNDAD